MKQLSGLDASFLYMETGKAWGHVSGLGVFRRPETPGWSAYEALSAQLERHRPPFNLVISNIPGPRQALALDQAVLEHYYPVSTITDSQGVNITLQSYLDIVDFSLVADRELMPDVDHLADLLVEEFASFNKLV